MGQSSTYCKNSRFHLLCDLSTSLVPKTFRHRVLTRPSLLTVKRLLQKSNFSTVTFHGRHKFLKVSGKDRLQVLPRTSKLNASTTYFHNNATVTKTIRHLVFKFLGCWDTQLWLPASQWPATEHLKAYHGTRD